MFKLFSSFSTSFEILDCTKLPLTVLCIIAVLTKNLLTYSNCILHCQNFSSLRLNIHDDTELHAFFPHVVHSYLYKPTNH